MKSIGIIGCGFVGSAVREGMSHAFDIYSYDKLKGPEIMPKGGSLVPCVSSMIDDHLSKDCIDVIVGQVDGPIFVCVPTPMQPDGSCSTKIVEDVVRSISESARKLDVNDVVVAIKSTVVPGTTLRLNQTFDNIRVCFNPEFLTERNAAEDFKNQDRIIVGGPHEGTSALKCMYEQAYPNVPVTKTSSTIAEMIKYMTNCFLATKVAFANEMSQICEKMDIDYDKVVEYATKDKRLGTSHWSVPGPDGKKGFGLTCFPKDLNAMISLAKNHGVEPSVMSAVWQKNLEVRPERDWEQLKGRAVTEPSES